MLANIKATEMSQMRQRSILLVEDNQTNVLLIRRAIGKVERNIQIQAVENGEAAVHYLQAKRTQSSSEVMPDLVLTDIKMPRMNGMELLAWIKQQPEWANLPVVILSSSGDPEEIDQAMELGATSYIIRPGSTSELVEAMRQILLSLSID